MIKLKLKSKETQSQQRVVLSDKIKENSETYCTRHTSSNQEDTKNQKNTDTCTIGCSADRLLCHCSLSQIKRKGILKRKKKKKNSSYEISQERYLVTRGSQKKKKGEMSPGRVPVK